MLDLNLTGKVAVVTGASLGIGKACVELMAEYGATVHFCARNQQAVDALDQYQPTSGAGQVIGYTADMSDADSTAKFIEKVQQTSTVDILINNVGAAPSRNFLYMTDDNWNDLFELNLMSAVRCTKAFLPKMREKKWGRVVMISTVSAKYPNASIIDYGASKAAMIAVGKSLASKYAKDGVLTNSVLPGLIHTPMWQKTAEEMSKSFGISPEEVIKNNGKSVPVGRYGTAEEVANVVLFLSSNAASYVNGVSWQVDGGNSSHI